MAVSAAVMVAGVTRAVHPELMAEVDRPKPKPRKDRRLKPSAQRRMARQVIDEILKRSVVMYR